MELRRRKHEHQHPDIVKSAAHRVERGKIQTPSAAATVKEEEEQGSYEVREELLASGEKSSMEKCNNRNKVTGRKRKADVVQEYSPVAAEEDQLEIMKNGQDISRKRSRGQISNLRCEPKKICEIVRLLNEPQREKLKELGFGCLLDFNMNSIGSRDLIVWLMDHLDRSTMVLDFGDNRKLEITEHAVHCVLGLQMGDLDPPSSTQKLSLVPLRKKLGVPEGKKYFEFTYLIEKIKSGGTDRLTMQCFMMIVLAKLLVCGSDPYVTQNIWGMVLNIDKFGNMDWCKFTVDYLRYSAGLWKKPGSKKKTVHGCSAFLVMYYLDNLNSKHQMNLVETPRVKFFAKEVIEKLLTDDMLLDKDGSRIFGNLNLRVQRHTCYDVGVFPWPQNRLGDLASSYKKLCVGKEKASNQQPDGQQIERELQEDRRQETEQQSLVHTSSEFVNVQINCSPEHCFRNKQQTIPGVSKEHSQGDQDGDSPVPVHGVTGAEAEAAQQATTSLKAQMKDFMPGTLELEILENRLSKLASSVAQVRARVPSQTENAELEQQVKELTEKLCSTKEELDAARATLRGTQATINSLNLLVSSTFVRLGDTRPVPSPDVANGSLEDAVKLLEDRVSLIEPVSRRYGADLATSSVAFSAAALLCREKKGAEALRDAVAGDTRRFLRKQGPEFGLLVSQVVDAVEQQHAHAPLVQGGEPTGTGEN